MKKWLHTRKNTIFLVGIVSLFFFSSSVKAQEYYEDPQVTLNKTTEKIIIDGQLDEAAWFSGEPAKDFWQYFPQDTTLANPQTEIYMTYDDKFLYIAAKCYSIGNDYITPSLRRDFRAGGNDNLTFLIDPFQDNTNAFVFGMNPFGVAREALISNGGNSGRDWNSAWDNKWKGNSAINDGYWSCEIAIPFSTLRFKEGSKVWNFNSYRFDTQTNTNSSWQRIPRQQIIMTLAHMGKMVWDEPLKKSGKNVSIIPYASGSYIQDTEEGLDADFSGNAGLDAKVSITTGLNLDLTVNPDFSQVEVDRQVINLDRFEVFFPERRQFFIENMDLFGSFGTSRINPFFSRRIGSGYNEVTETTEQVPILAGARLNGKLDNNWRLGVMNMQTNKKEEIPAFNYSVLALQRKVFSRSNVGLIFVNKQTISAPDTLEISPFDRVIGVDYNIASKDNYWNGKIFYHQGLTPNTAAGQFAHGAFLEYQRYRYSIQWFHSYVGENYEAETGFVPRTGYYNIAPEARYFFYPSSESKIDRHGPGVEGRVFWDPDFGRTDYQVELFYDIRFRNNSNMRATLQNEAIYLFEAFDPTRTDSEPLPADSLYSFNSFRMNYSSDQRRIVNFRISTLLGEFYNGNRYSLNGNVGIRLQPFAQIGIDFNLNRIALPDPYASRDLVLVGPRIDLTFSKTIFLTTFIQYNNQADNFNINTRFQWRFAPVSDLFIVYTDNYYASDFNHKTRAIVAKLTYWFNV
jgi:hypothetical protein